MNPQTIRAVYEQGVLRPLEQLDLPEHSRVEITVHPAQPSVPKAGTCYELAQRAGILGGLREAPRDLSSNPAHLDGFGSS